MSVINALRTMIRHAIRAVAVWLDRKTHGSISPDLITLTGVIMHIPIAVLIAVGAFGWAALLLVIFGLFDVLDGELARHQKRASARGMILDATTDRLKEVLIYSGIAYYIAGGSSPEWTVVAVLACGASICVSYAKAKGEAALATQRKLTDHHQMNRYFAAGLVPFEIRMTIIVLGLISNQIVFATSVVAFLATITVISRLQTISRELS